MGDCGTCGKMLQAEEASPAAAQSTEGRVEGLQSGGGAGEEHIFRFTESLTALSLAT